MYVCIILLPPPLPHSPPPFPFVYESIFDPLPRKSIGMSTRIFVRGLPQNFTDTDFRSHFSAQGAVTDAKLIPSRRIGYVGYKTAEEAEKAVKYFNKSFIRMSRVWVEIAKPVADKELPRAWSKHTPGSTAYKRKHESQAIADIPTSLENVLKRKRGEKPPENDHKLKEFLEAMAPASKSKTWANEDLSFFGQGRVVATEDTVVVAAAGESDDEYESIPVKTKKDRVVEDVELKGIENDDGGEAEEEEEEEEEDQEITVVGDIKKEAEAAVPVSDADWLRSKTSRLLDLTDDVDSHLVRATLNETTKKSTPRRVPAVEKEIDDSNGVEEEMTQPTQPEEQKGTTEEDAVFETISRNGRLFLRNLSYSVTEEDLREYFIEHGDLEEVHLPIDNKTNTSKGFAYIHYTNPIDAVEAYKHLDGRIFQGRLLHILPAAPKRENKLDEYTLSKLPLKKQRELKKKAGATSSQFNWNSMYMNPDAVMSSVADRLNVSKADLLDPTSSDAAVRQAYAETHVIQETKAYFAQQGIDLDAFNKKDRDDKVILIKNFPYGTKIDELRKILSEFGQLGRVLMPPAGTIAIAEFLSAPVARSAFAGLAYRRFKESVLFLEKAPRGLFKFDQEKTQPNAEQLAAAAISHAKDAKTSASDLLSHEDATADTATLFVRNLNFSTTSSLLSNTFNPIDGFISARVKTKTNPKKQGQVLSMGFGFVEFRSKAQADAARQAMDGFVLEGHKLLIKASHKGLDAAAERKKEDNKKKEVGKRTKIIIKNLPFEASKKDVRALFGHYGTLRTVRVPKKFGGAARGFAFAEFVTSREAENAMNALRDTHLLGRRLILEYAVQDAENAEEEIERMEGKVREQTDVVTLHRLRADRKRKVEITEDGGVAED